MRLKLAKLQENNKKAKNSKLQKAVRRLKEY